MYKCVFKDVLNRILKSAPILIQGMRRNEYDGMRRGRESESIIIIMGKDYSILNVVQQKTIETVCISEELSYINRRIRMYVPYVRRYLWTSTGLESKEISEQLLILRYYVLILFQIKIEWTSYWFCKARLKRD